MGKLFTGVDCGRTGLRVVQVSPSGGSFKLTRYFSREREAGDSPGQTLLAAVEDAGWKMGECRVGLTGRDLVLRYTKVLPVPDWQLKNLVQLEIEDLGSQSGGEIAADFNLLPVPTDFSGEDTVLLALVKEGALRPYLEAQSSAFRVGAFTPSAVALYNAYLKLGKPGSDAVLLANIGAENVDVALVMGSDLYFARNISGGGALLTEAVSSRFNVSEAKADQLKRELADLNPSRKGGFESSQQEKVTHAVLGAAGQIPSMLQSTVMFCKTQTKVPDLKLSRVLLCGGGARMRGLPEYLGGALGAPVEIFDPFEEADLSALTDAEARDLDERRLESVVALGLAISAADPAAYSIEILPKEIQKKREFASKGLYLWLGAAAIALFLGADLLVTRSRALGSMDRASRLHRQNEQRKKVDKQVADLLEEIKTLSKRAQILEQKAGVSSALAQTLRMLRAGLPGELWITSTAVELRAKDEELKVGADPVPIVRIEGRGREGAASLSQIFRSFTEKLAAQIPQGALRQTTSQAKGFSFTLELNLFVREEKKPEG